MNNDELQRAIDDITKDNASAETVPAVDGTAENEQLANELTQTAAPAAEVEPTVAPDVPDFGVAPAPVVPEMPGMPPVGTPEPAETPAPEIIPGGPSVDAPEAPAAPVAPEPVEPTEEASAVAATEAPASEGSDGDTLNEALKELYPLLDKVDMPVEEKFDITMKFGSPAKALDLAKKITDETARANALLEIVNKLK